jgi:hypothetical protein
MAPGPRDGEPAARADAPEDGAGATDDDLTSPERRPRSEIGARTEVWRTSPGRRARARQVLGIGGLVVLALAFELALGQAPLYTGEQHATLLHGLARAGVGSLELDPLARTADPAPVTNVLVALSASLGAEWLLLVLHALLIGAYGIALVALGARVLMLDDLPRRAVLVAALLLAHSALAERVGVGAVGTVRSLVTAGLGGESAPSLVFGPALFGVLFVVALLLYARGRPLAAIAAAGSAAAADPALLPIALVLCVALLADTRARRRAAGTVARGAALATVLLAPVAVYTLLTFAPVPGEAHEAAQRVLVDLTFPRGTRPEDWFTAADAARLAIVAGGLAAAWRSVLFPVLALSVAASAALTAVAIATRSHALLLLDPWGATIFLVPVCAALLLAAAARAAFAIGRLLGRIASLGRHERAARLGTAARTATLVLAGFATALALIAGLERILRLRAEPEREPYAPLVAGEVGPATLVLAPPNMHELRLDAAVPVYVDARVRPWGDLEVLEWRARLAVASRAFGRRSLACGAIATIVRREPITHVVTEGRTPARPCPSLRRVRTYGVLALFRVERGSRADARTPGLRPPG